VAYPQTAHSRRKGHLKKKKKEGKVGRLFFAWIVFLLLFFFFRGPLTSCGTRYKLNLFFGGNKTNVRWKEKNVGTKKKFRKDTIQGSSGGTSS
jgi:hypothetical protein